MQTANTGREVQYLVLPDPSNPWLLARVRWPDVFEAISPTQPNWQSDVGLFDLPYEPTARTVSADTAAAIAARWGARLSDAGDAPESYHTLIRRMPAKWGSLSPAEQRAWALQYIDVKGGGAPGSRRRRRRRKDAPVIDLRALDAVDPSMASLPDLVGAPLHDRSDDGTSAKGAGA